MRLTEVVVNPFSSAMQPQGATLSSVPLVAAVRSAGWKTSLSMVTFWRKSPGSQLAPRAVGTLVS